MSKILDRIADNFSEEDGFERIITSYKIAEILRFTKGARVLDLGCGVGLITEELAKKHKAVTGVDGSENKIRKARRDTKQKNIKFIYSMFQDFHPEIKYDCVILSNVLEHVTDPVELLKNIYSWLKDGGRVIATVPNSDSLHKRIGLAMGKIRDLKQLTISDKAKGHLRIYDREKLISDLKSAKFSIFYIGGIFFKPLSSAQMLKLKDKKLYDALFSLRKDFPDLCSSFIIVGDK